MVTGWSTDPLAPCPGGVPWVDASWSGDRNTVSNAPNAQVGAQLYQITGQSFYLSWAKRMYNWVNVCLAAPGGLYYDHVSSTGTINTTEWSYNQGTMIGAGVLLYKITGNMVYLNNATATAQAAVVYYGTGSQTTDPGSRLQRDLLSQPLLTRPASPEPGLRERGSGDSSYMWSKDRDPSTGLFLPTSDVNSTAPMVEIYALLAGSAPDAWACHTGDAGWLRRRCRRARACGPLLGSWPDRSAPLTST